MSQYKAVIMDVDGTLSNFSSTNMPLMPTKVVIDAINKAKEKVSVGVATSRPLIKMKPILEEIKFNCFCILHNGAQIIDPFTLETTWARPLDIRSLKPLHEIAKMYGIRAYFSNFESNLSIESFDQLASNSVADVFYDGVEYEISNTVYSELEKIPNIAIHRLSSRWENKYEISITNKEATKESAILEVANLMQISPEDIIGIGDAHNDIPLLNACGYKVAMGNAVDEVKAIANMIAPTVEEDGVKHILEKLVL